VALIGLSGAGKSTVAPLAAARLGFPPVDLDAEIEKETGRSPASFLASGAEAEFRAAEAHALERALSERRPGVVIACGGGIVKAPGTRALLRSRAFVVWLRVSPSRAQVRLGAEGVRARPLIAGAGAGAEGPGDPGTVESSLEAMLRERAPLYEGAADAVIDTDGLTPDEVAERVAALCRPDPTWP